MIVLGLKHGYSTEELEKVMTKSLEPTGLILLVTACGGVLRYVLQYSTKDFTNQNPESLKCEHTVAPPATAAFASLCVAVFWTW